MYLAQIKYDDSFSSKVCNELEVIKLTNEMDFNGIVDMEVFDLSEFGKPKKLHYLGWRPMCHIQYVDNEGNVVIDGYGEDH